LAYLIDTNIAIHARDGYEPVLEKLLQNEGAVFLSALSLAELQRGFHSSAEFGALRKARLKLLLTGIPILPFDAAAAEAYGDIIGQLGWAKSRDLDRLIAGHALASRSILVTANIQDFIGVPGLNLENWVAAS
jgi:tRNA(fMet)-specific endonuclease VapC